LALAVPSAAGQVGAIVAGGLIGWGLLANHAPTRPGPPLAVHLPRAWSIIAAILFFGLLIGLPLAAAALPVQPLRLFDSFYRSGALVFGGGHVVLPLLQAEVVPRGWVSNDAFLAGYGAAQAVPGPLFTFSAYLGTVMGTVPNGWAGGLLCLVAIFLPSFLLLIAALPFWDGLRRRPAVQSALRGSRRLSSASCSRRSTSRCGPARSSARPILLSASSRCYCSRYGRCRPGSS